MEIKSIALEEKTNLVFNPVLLVDLRTLSGRDHKLLQGSTVF